MCARWMVYKLLMVRINYSYIKSFIINFIIKMCITVCKNRLNQLITTLNHLEVKTNHVCCIKLIGLVIL